MIIDTAQLRKILENNLVTDLAVLTRLEDLAIVHSPQAPPDAPAGPPPPVLRTIKKTKPRKVKVDNSANGSNTRTNGLLKCVLDAAPRLGVFGPDEMYKALDAKFGLKPIAWSLSYAARFGKLKRVTRGASNHPATYQALGQVDTTLKPQSKRGRKPKNPTPEPQSAPSVAPSAPSVPSGPTFGSSDVPDYDNMSLEELQERRDKAATDRDEALRNGQTRLFRILSDKVLMLNGRIARRGK